MLNAMFLNFGTHFLLMITTLVLLLLILYYIFILPFVPQNKYGLLILIVCLVAFIYINRIDLCNGYNHLSNIYFGSYHGIPIYLNFYNQINVNYMPIILYLILIYIYNVGILNIFETIFKKINNIDIDNVDNREIIPEIKTPTYINTEEI